MRSITFRTGALCFAVLYFASLVVFLLVTLSISAERIIYTLVAATIEELLFRKFLFKFLRKHLSAVKAISVSSLAFAAVHFNLFHFPFFFFMGVLLSCLYILSKSIWPGCFFHAAENLLEFYFRSTDAGGLAAEALDLSANGVLGMLLMVKMVALIGLVVLAARRRLL